MSDSPYVPPASTAPEDLTDPRFQVLPAFPWGKDARLFLLPLIYISCFSYYQVNRLLHTGASFRPDGPAWTAFGTLAFLLVSQAVIKRLYRSGIRRRSLIVNHSKPLAGGRVCHNLNRPPLDRDLFLTPESLILLSPRAGSLDLDPYRIRLAEIAGIESPGWFGLGGRLLIHLHSGETISLTAGRPRLWKKLIDQACAAPVA